LCGELEVLAGVIASYFLEVIRYSGSAGPSTSWRAWAALTS